MERRLAGIRRCSRRRRGSRGVKSLVAQAPAPQVEKPARPRVMMLDGRGAQLGVMVDDSSVLTSPRRWVAPRAACGLRKSTRIAPRPRRACAKATS